MPLFGQGYDHIDDAAAAALYAVAQQPRVSDQEYMALILRGLDDKIYRSDFQTDGDRYTSSWTGIPEGEVLGTVHSHPSPKAKDRYRNTDFSPQDIATAEQIKGAAYVAAMQAGGQALDRKLVPPHRADGTSMGKEFLAQFPIDEMRAHIMKRMGRRPDDPRGAYLTDPRADAIRSRVALATSP